VDQGAQLSVCVAHCNRSVIDVEGERLTLFPRTVDSLVHAAREANLRIELLVADWPDVPQLAPLRKWLPRAIGKIPLTIVEMSGPFNKGAALNHLAHKAASDRLFFLDCDMLVPWKLLRRGLGYLNEGKAWFPGYMAMSRGGALRSPSTPRHGTGNAFMLRAQLLECGGWPSKTTWGNFDRPVSDWFLSRGLSAEDLNTREPVTGFVHLWHPKLHGWDRLDIPAVSQPRPRRVVGLGLAKSTEYLRTLDRGLYCARNKVIAESVATAKPRTILELAAAHPQRAQMILKKLPDIQRYLWSDWSRVAVRFARPYLRSDNRARVARLDATLPATWAGQWDAILCDSLEHLPNDLEILSAVRPGTRLFLSMPDWQTPTHARAYISEQFIRDRFGGILDFVRITAFPWRTKRYRHSLYLAEAVRRSP